MKEVIHRLFWAGKNSVLRSHRNGQLKNTAELGLDREPFFIHEKPQVFQRVENE
jgi:hypothetical protein